MGLAEVAKRGSHSSSSSSTSSSSGSVGGSAGWRWVSGWRSGGTIHADVAVVLPKASTITRRRRESVEKRRRMEEEGGGGGNEDLVWHHMHNPLPYVFKQPRVFGWQR